MSAQQLVKAIEPNLHNLCLFLARTHEILTIACRCTSRQKFKYAKTKLCTIVGVRADIKQYCKILKTCDNKIVKELFTYKNKMQQENLSKKNEGQDSFHLQETLKKSHLCGYSQQAVGFQR